MEGKERERKNGYVIILLEIKKKLKKKTMMYLILFLSALYRIDEAHERQMTLQ